MLIAIGNGKGGVGKSYIATHLTNWFTLHGYSVVLVDCDAQRGSSQYLELLNSKQAVVVLDCVEDIQGKLTSLSEEYDVVVIDCPGSLNEVAPKIFSIVDAVILPTSGDNFDGIGCLASVGTGIILGER